MDIVDGPRVYEHKRAMGTASTLAIGTANPSNVMLQSDFPDFYFRVTNSDHIKEELKDRFRRIGEKSAIRKRHLYIDEALLGANPEMTTYGGPSLDKRKDIISAKIPERGAAAALKEWGRPVEDITHLISPASEIEWCVFLKATVCLDGVGGAASTKSM